MEGIERIHKLLEKLEKAIENVYPEYTTGSFTIDKDGYMHISITKWGENTSKIEETPRREIFSQHRSKVIGGWSNDESKAQNDYLSKKGILLEE